LDSLLHWVTYGEVCPHNIYRSAEQGIDEGEKQLKIKELRWGLKIEYGDSYYGVKLNYQSLFLL